MKVDGENRLPGFADDGRSLIGLSQGALELDDSSQGRHESQPVVEQRRIGEHQCRYE